jgi:hypothetical protein
MAPLNRGARQFQAMAQTRKGPLFEKAAQKLF